MHCVQKTVEVLKFALKSHQNQKFHTNSFIVKILAKLMEDIDLNEPLIFEILIMRISADAANSQKFWTFKESKFHQINSIRMLF